MQTAFVVILIILSAVYLLTVFKKKSCGSKGKGGCGCSKE